MTLPRIGWVGAAIICFLLGIGVCAFGPRLLHVLFPSSSEGRTERMRVTSPNGQFDAVMILESYGGAMGGFDWYVYIVQRGKAVPVSGLSPIFSAGKLDHENLVWKQPKLLEIQYDIGYINDFRNVWCSYEVGTVGPTGEHNYCVEIRLAPVSPDFSIVNPEGGFRYRH